MRIIKNLIYHFILLMRLLKILLACIFCGKGNGWFVFWGLFLNY